MTQQERQVNRRFKKQDQYHLPELAADGSDGGALGAPDDPRVMSHAELEEYARQFHADDGGDAVSVYDFAKVDFDSAFFRALPAADQYSILNAARLRSRLRMGYSKEQLETLFPDRMAFSRFQIERVRERNQLTQRLMNLNNGAGGDGDFEAAVAAAGGRIAGEKGREYVLVKNDAVEGGWALGVVSSSSKKHEGERNMPIDVDRLAARHGADGDGGEKDEDDDDDDQDGGFEDVPIEGLNRLPKLVPGRTSLGTEMELHEIAERRRKLYDTAKNTARGITQVSDDAMLDESDSLFIESDMPDIRLDSFSHSNGGGFSADIIPDEDNDDYELRCAIAMSLEKEDHGLHDENLPSALSFPNQDEGLKTMIAPDSRTAAFTVLTGIPGEVVDGFDDDDDDDDDMNLQAALARSRRRAAESGQQVQRDDTTANQREGGQPASLQGDSGQKPADKAFDGPLPFEKLDLRPTTSSKAPHPDAEEQRSSKNLPLPPWFSADVRRALEVERAFTEQQASQDVFVEPARPEPPILRKQAANEVIEIDSSDDEGSKERSTRAVTPPNAQTELASGPKSPSGEEPAAITSDKVSPAPIQVERMDVDNDTPAPTPNITQPPTAFASVDEAREDSRQDDARPSSEIEWSRSPSPTFENVYTSGDTQALAENIPAGAPPPLSERDLAPEVEVREPSPLQPPEDDDNDELHDINEPDDYSDPEDEQLLQQLAGEAAEHARFASSLNQKPPAQNQAEYERELRALRSQQKRDRRDADEVSRIMVEECQQLLALFGLPFVTAPQEAEAQCAELVRLGLVDGIATDDADCFLFGGTRVFKNMFSQARVVECFVAADVERELGLDRGKLVRLAHLLGSDYTEGIAGVGPVTALEILSEFGSDRGLEDFKEWWQGVQMGVHLADDDKSAFRKKFVSEREKNHFLFFPRSFYCPSLCCFTLQPTQNRP